jgi:hypothetical protein
MAGMVKKGGANSMVTRKFNYRFQRNTPSTYGHEIGGAKNVVESTFNSKNKNKKLIEYILSVAKLRVRGNNHFVAGIGDLFDKAMKMGFSIERIRQINLYINYLGEQSAKGLIERAQTILEEDPKCNLVP